MSPRRPFARRGSGCLIPDSRPLIPETYLAIERVCVAYGGVRVLSDVTLDVARGELVALLGSSGCGKTTLLRSIAGFVTPQSGRIRIAGRDITGLPPEKRGTAMMFQSYALWPHMSVAGNIGYGMRMRGAARGAIARRVEELLALMQLQGYAARSVVQLSGGQRQRVALARALAVDPQLLLLDEPMSNLDYKVRIELRHELRALQKRIGITAVYVTHDREEALTLADRIAVLDAGRVVQYAPPEEIFHRPASAFVAGFMGADNAIALTRDSEGRLRSANGNGAAGEPLTAHFRSDVARIEPSGNAANDAELRLSGRIVQAQYVGQGYRYRVRTDGADVWAHASDRIDEGAPVAVVVPREALLLFPRATTQADRGRAAIDVISD
jgi:putative spermidine/putrescine transport system ATP-binding protein